MKKKIAIIHYFPLEFYPPITNLLNCISKVNNNKVQVFSTHNNKGRETYSNAKLDDICRVSSPQLSDFSILRLWKYLWFNVRVFFKLCWLRPDSILYFESNSVGPVYWYLKLVNSRTKLFIHYHEYVSRELYANGMQLTKWYHKQEQNYLYKKASSISQTNRDRISLFLKDNSMVSENKLNMLPNYPPKSWLNNKKYMIPDFTGVVKTVYVGSLSLKDTYIKEYCEWVQSQKGKVIFDIYAYNLHNDTIDYLVKLNSKYINFYIEGVEYNQIPKLLANYDVGVILYKALTDNYKFNAPNKLFEYMACGLEVWYSEKMLGIQPYNKQSSPRILSVNFDDIATSILLDANKVPMELYQHFFAESIYEPYIEKLIF